MGYAKVHSVALVGMAGQLVLVEADVASGLPTLVVSGLPDAALCEARDRVRAAIVNSGESWPNRRITVNLLPAHLPKHGSGFDVPVAMSLLAGAGVLPPAALDAVRFDFVAGWGGYPLVGTAEQIVDELAIMADLGFDGWMLSWVDYEAELRQWIDEIMPLLEQESDPLGVEDLATHKLPLEQAPHAYEIFQKKEDGAIKILLQP
jgi:threonine dehydrogenase-like Zn-dependent dehydrogenase